MSNKTLKDKIEPIIEPVTELKAEIKNSDITNKTVMYLGIPIVERDALGGVLFQLDYGRIFNNGLPVEVIERLKVDKDLKKMFVPIAEVPAVMKQLTIPDSRYSLIIKELKKKYVKTRRV